MDESLLGKGALDKPEDYLKPESPQHFEIAGAMAPAVWVEKKPNGGFTTYPKRNQTVKSDCTTYAAAKALSIDELSENGNWRELSPDSVYPYVVQPGGGASSLDVMNFIVVKGMTLDALYPSDGLNEIQAEDSSKIGVDAKIIANVYKPQGIIQSAADFETIASIIYSYQQQGIKKGVTVSLLGQNNGTWLSPYPTPPSNPTAPAVWAHRVIVTDFGLINGKKFLAIDNSWGSTVGIEGEQFLSEDYAQFLYGAIYTLSQPDGAIITPPPMIKYQWNTDLAVGSTGPDVTALQEALQCLGMFPISSVVKPTGNFFGLTQQSVKIFQQSFGLPITGIVDAATRAVLNNTFK